MKAQSHIRNTSCRPPACNGLYRSVPGATLTLCPRLISSGPLGRQTFGLQRTILSCSWGAAVALSQADSLWPVGPTDLRPAMDCALRAEQFCTVCGRDFEHAQGLVHLRNASCRPSACNGLCCSVPGAPLSLCPRLVSSGPVGRQTFGLCRLTPVAASGMHRNERRGRLGCDSRKARAEHAQASCRPSACLSFARGSWGDADALPQAGFLWPGGPTDLRPVSADAGGPPPGYTGTSAEANWAASRVRHGPSMPKLPADLRPASRSLPVPGATLMLCPRLGSSGPVGWQTFGLCRLTPVGRLRDAQERAPRPTGPRLAQGT
jgi:hypothetical protein